jgi:hypothetical protein
MQEAVMASDRQAAETYLRLMAETELRLALTLPKVRHPRRRVRRMLRRFAVRRAGIPRGRATYAQVAARAAISTEPIRRRVRRLARQRVGRVVLALATDRRRHRQGADAGIHRLSIAADALAAVGAIDEEVAETVVANHVIALELRRRIAGPMFRFKMHRRPTAAPPAGPFRAIGLASRTAFDLGGRPAEVSVLGLVTAPNRAVLTIAAKPPKPTLEDEFASDLFDSVSAVDNQGTRYSAGFSGGGGAEEWDGDLELHPVPGPAVRWLDMTFWPGTPPVRINFDHAQSPPEPMIEPLPSADLAERYVDRLAEQLLERHSHWPRREINDVTSTLLGAEVIKADSPAIARLVTLARRIGADPPAELAEAGEEELPERWRSVLENADQQDGPNGLAPVGAVLPELDGARWVIAGLRSRPDSADLGIRGWGVQHRHYRRHVASALPSGFGLWAHDNAGRWHVASSAGGGWGGGHTDLRLRLTPPLHPHATCLDVILTGKTGKVMVTLPLEWAS